MKQEKLEVCLGKLTPINDRCLKCKKDEANRNCPDYFPMQIHQYYVIEDNSEELLVHSQEGISKIQVEERSLLSPDTQIQKLNPARMGGVRWKMNYS